VPLVLDLLRHGPAAPQDPRGDQARPLTPEGERAVRRLTERLARESPRPGRAFSSPTKRAKDSALIVVTGLGLELPIEELSELEPEHEPSEVLDALAALGVTEGHALLVGHQPQLGRLTGYLTGTERGLSPGELVRIQCPGKGGKNAGMMVLALKPGD
jgi:phosphohistidine phosphatase